MLLAAEDLVRLADEVAPAARALERRHPDLGTPTTFEVGTALALLAFARQQVQVAVVEVGIGGAHDATRVVDAPVAAVAPISYDHVAVLGPTIGDIAREKAGVFAEGGSAAIGRQLPEAAAVLTRVAEVRRCRLWWLDQEFGWEAVGPPLPTAPCRLWGPWGRIEGVKPSLVGRHQRDNAAVAAMATHLLGQHGFPVDRDAIAAGLSTAVWPGRFQVVPGSPLLVLDGAHNRASAEALAATLRECFPRRPVVVVLAVGEDKDVDGITAALSTIAHRAVVTRTTHERAMDAERVGQLLAARGVAVEVRACSDDALQRAMAAAGPDGVVCVTGSLFLVGEALASLESSGRVLPHGTATSIQPPPPAMTPHH
jgi:dihydrofolate synthase/folylpolyglutamate synthase